LPSLQFKASRHSVGIDASVYFGRQPASRPAHQPCLGPARATAALMYANNGSADHQDGAVMGFREGLHDRVPDASHPPTNKSIAAGRVRPKGLRQIAPWCSHRNIQKMPLRTRRSSTLGTPRGLFGRNGLIAFHSKSVSSYLMIRGLDSGALNHVYFGRRNTEPQARDGADIGHAANMLKATRMTQSRTDWAWARGRLR
jgi:hypothetical protein